MCDIPDGLKACGADSRHRAPVGGGAEKQMVGRSFRRVWAEQRWREGNHLPLQQKQNKPSGQERPRGWRSSGRGGSFLKTSPAQLPLPLLIGGFESCCPPSAAGQRLGEVGAAPVSQPGRRWEVGRDEFRSPRVVLRSSRLLPRCPVSWVVLEPQRARSASWPRRTEGSLIVGFCLGHRG